MEHRTTIEEIQENDLEQMTGDLTDKNGSRPRDRGATRRGHRKTAGELQDQGTIFARATALTRSQDNKSTETFEMLNKTFPNDAPKRTTVFEWHSRFKAGRISIEDDPRQGRPKFQRTDENVQKITDLIKENPRTTLLELEQDTGISKTTIGRIVTEDLKLKKTPAKFIPRFLTNEQKLCRLATCEDMMEMTRTDPEWKDKIITGDETWVYGYDPETKPQTAEWRGSGEPRPKKSRNKVLLVAFSDNKGIVHHEYLPAGQTVIKEMYLGILRRLREAIRKKRPEKWTNGGWILHHDNARPHTAHLMTSFLAKNGTQILLQPPYFPDIAPNDFFLFPKLKAVLKGRHFDTRDGIIEKSPLALKSIPKEAYKNCFDNWEKRWRCVLETRLAPCVLSTGPTNFDPARSPDLTPLDFFLWGTVKDGVYKRKPRNLDILWNEIQAVCREISLDVLIRCTESVVTRTQNCIDAAGGALKIRNRQHQTTLTRFRTGHLKPLKIENNNKIYPTCPKCCLAPAAPEHILACIRFTKQDLWERPLLIIKQLEEHELMEFV
ncbi:hypothetical protein LAZ67_4003857 [Cordylochernes scorpioides]|uniref:Mos1 transposase HTH domain-containing protein n=1 Tax=Cordylochernes scorpioides TaxID=51811 RepID=A0ABY6KES6_9ARAC|nr:hypothetical protein LAZ67_4003857 [Cordylochernes scorpioides]